MFFKTANIEKQDQKALYKKRKKNSVKETMQGALSKKCVNLRQ